MEKIGETRLVVWCHEQDKHLLIKCYLTNIIFSVKNLQKGQDCQNEPNNSTFDGSLFSKDVETKDINGNFKDSGVKLTESEQSNSKNEQNDSFSITQIAAKNEDYKEKLIKSGLRSDCRSITSTIEDFFYSQDSQTESEIESNSKTDVICNDFDSQNDNVEKDGPESHYYRHSIYLGH